VSLYDQPPFAPEAVSLTGRAVFRNVRRQLVAFGGQAKAKVLADQTSAAEHAVDVATIDPNSPITQSVYDARQEALVVQRGGFVRGDVLVGDSSATDAQLTDPGSGLLPGFLNFVLRWDGNANLDLGVSTPGTDQVAAFDDGNAILSAPNERWAARVHATPIHAFL